MFPIFHSSPFKAGSAALFDVEGHDLAVVVLKATFTIPEKGGKPDIAKDQLDVFDHDQYKGEPGWSDFMYPSDLVMGKRGTDIGLNGTVYSPLEIPVPQMRAAVMVGDISKTLLVFGDRFWTKRLFGPGYTMTEPEPFSRMPLSWVRMFGGMTVIDTGERIPFEENPVGTGFMMKHGQPGGTRLPNFEDPEQRIRSYRETYPPASFGFVPPSSPRRRAFAGTFDETWVNTRRPLYPRDMDLRFFNCAQKELTADGFLKGGESVHLVNLTSDSSRTFALPAYDIHATFKLNGEKVTRKADIHTLVIEPDTMRFSMTWFASERFRTSRSHVEYIEFDIRNL